MVQNVTLLNSVQNGLGISGLTPKQSFVAVQQAYHPQQTTQNANTNMNNLISFPNPVMVIPNTTVPFTTAAQTLDTSGYLELSHREYQSGNYASAEKYCQAVLTSDPQNISALLLLSSIYFQLKNFDK